MVVKTPAGPAREAEIPGVGARAESTAKASRVMIRFHVYFAATCTYCYGVLRSEYYYGVS